MKNLFILASILFFKFSVTAQLPITGDLKNHLVLNGTSDYIEIPANAAMAFTGNATAEAIVRTDNASLEGEDVIFINCIEPDAWGIQIQLLDGKPKTSVVIAGAEYAVVSSAPLTPNQTYHIAGVRNGTNLYLYVNGILNNQRTVPASDLRQSAGSVSRIGRPQNSQPFYFGGCIDEVRVWNVARTSAEILSNKDITLAGNEPGLVAYYQLNETATGANNTVKNSAAATGSALDGITVGNLTSPYLSTVCPSVFCDALIYNSLPDTTLTGNNTYCFDGTWKNFYDPENTKNILASINENNESLGNITIDDYEDSAAGVAGFEKYMRRHFVIKTSLTFSGTKRIRLYYTNADFTDLQENDPGLTSSSQLSITKYHGSSEDGVFNTSEGLTTFIPSSSINTGTAYGQNYLEFDVTDMGEFWIHTGASVLPLHITKFDAAKRDHSVNISWTAVDEINVKHYEIERSVNGREFSSIALKKANNQFLNNYLLVDPLLDVPPHLKTFYYRIKQVGNDGSSNYSNIAEVNFNKKTDITIFPNPSNGFVIVSGQNIQTLQLLNLDGQLLKTWKPSINKRYNIIDVPNGYYLLRLINANTSQTEKLLIYK